MSMQRGNSACISLFLALVCRMFIAGWSSLAARRAHNPKVVGSNPTPATSFFDGGLVPLF